eukprot:g34821.t1
MSLRHQNTAVSQCRREFSLTMGEPNEIAEGVGAINLAGGGFWKTWGEVEEKAPTEMKNPRLVRNEMQP